MKHIKFTATPVGPDFQTVEVVIVEQSHVRERFGIGGSDRFKASNGMELRSIACPEIYRNYICVRGDLTCGNDNKLIFTTSEYNKFREAAEEYNEYFKDKPKSKKPQRLRVHAEAIGPDFKNVSVTVVEQSCFEGQFGNKFIYEKIGDFVHGKVRLCSSTGGSGVNFLEFFVPSEYKNKGLIGTFYVANKVTKEDKEKLKTVVTVEVWQEILKTVEVFNKEFCEDISETELAEIPVEKKPEVQKDRYFVRTKSNSSNHNFAAGLVGKVVKESNSGRSVTVTLPNGQTSNWLKENCVEITEIPVVEKKRWFVRTKPNRYAIAGIIASVGTVGKFVQGSVGGVHVKLPSGKTEFWDSENCVEVRDLPNV